MTPILFCSFAILLQTPAPDSAPPPAATTAVDSPPGNVAASDVISRIREEGLKHSQVMETLEYLTDIIGPRLTGSPSMKRANEWTRDRMSSWGLSNAHLEPWGPFGRGWSLQKFSVQVVEPQCIPLIAFPKAWCAGTDGPVLADVIYLDAAAAKDLDAYKGKLKGTVVMVSGPQDISPHFEPEGRRLDDKGLLELADAPPPAGAWPGV